MSDDHITPERRYPQPAPEHAGVVDVGRIAEALHLIDADMAVALRAATFEASGRVMLGNAASIAAGVADKVPTAEAVKVATEAALADRPTKAEVSQDIAGKTGLTALGAGDTGAKLFRAADAPTAKAALGKMGNADLSDMPANTFKGASVVGPPADLNTTQAWSILSPAGKADQAAVSSGTDDSKFVTPLTLASSKAWTTARKIVLSAHSAVLDIPIPTTGSLFNLTLAAAVPADNSGTGYFVVYRISTDNGATYISAAGYYHTDFFVSSRIATLPGASDDTLGYLGVRSALQRSGSFVRATLMMPSQGSYMSVHAQSYGPSGEQIFTHYGGYASSVTRPTHIRIFQRDGAVFAAGTTVVLEGA